MENLTFSGLLMVVHKNEFKKFIPMCLLKFFILFNYSCIHTIKESLVIPNLGAETACFIEVWIILPAVFIFTFTYLKLSIVIPSKEKLFYLTCGSFLIFFLVFAFILYPNIDYFRFSKPTFEALIAKLPHLKRFIIIFYNWPIALFNIFSELWINSMLSLLFWQYANSIITSEQAKRFYPIFGIIGNFSLISSGIFLRQICISCSDEVSSITWITILIMLVGLFCMAIFRYLSIANSPKNLFKSSENTYQNKPKLSFKESLVLVFSSRYLWLMAVSVVAYGIAIALSQGLWKAQAMKLYPTTEQYILFMADYQKWAGIISIIMMFVGSIVVRKLSWLASAVIAPLVMLATGSIFFIWISLNKFIIQIISENTYLIFSVLIGTLHIIWAKSAKYSLSDTTKELAYIPLEENLRDKGKAAVDCLGNA